MERALRRNFVILPVFAVLTQEVITNSAYTFYLLDVRGLGMATLAAVMPVASEVVNRRLDPRWRATALSTITMGERLVAVVMVPAMALFAERGWFAGAYAVLAALLGVVLVALGARVSGLREDVSLTSRGGSVDGPLEGSPASKATPFGHVQEEVARV